MGRVKLCSMCQLLCQSRTGQTTCAQLMQTRNRQPIARWGVLLSGLTADVTVRCRQCSPPPWAGTAVPAAALVTTLLRTAAGHSQAPHAQCR